MEPAQCHAKADMSKKERRRGKAEADGEQRADGRQTRDWANWWSTAVCSRNTGRENNGEEERRRAAVARRGDAAPSRTGLTRRPWARLRQASYRLKRLQIQGRRLGAARNRRHEPRARPWPSAGWSAARALVLALALALARAVVVTPAALAVVAQWPPQDGDRLRHRPNHSCLFNVDAFQPQLRRRQGPWARRVTSPPLLILMSPCTRIGTDICTAAASARADTPPLPHLPSSPNTSVWSEDAESTATVRLALAIAGRR